MSTIFTPEVIAMVSGILVAVLIGLIPQLEGVKTELLTVVTILVGLLIAAFGGERIAAARSSGATQAERLSTSTPKPYAAPPRSQPPL